MPENENKRLRILVVDDDPGEVRLLQKHLTDAGFEVLTARNGIEAMHILLTDGPPIVITDWVMPEMDGLELCKAIRQHEAIPFAYIIIVTAVQTSQSQLVEALNAGADDYLCKPLNVKELLARLQPGERIVKLQGELDARTREAHRYNAQMEIATTKLESANEELNRMATSDELTGLINRREALNRLSDQWASSVRHDYPLAILAMDIDRFKSCNDAYGHAVGDMVLRETAKILRREARREECVCRVGGEEFLIICPHATEAMATVGAERLRRAVEANVIESGELTLRATVSLGVAERTAEMKSPDDLLRAADDALYLAKDSGRNAVWLASRKPASAEALIESAAAFGTAPAAAHTLDEPGTILVVDDDASTRSLCKTFLERDGHEVLEATDGADALKRVESDTPEVIIMDAVMPDMDGLACTRRLKANPSTRMIPVILASARTDATDIVAGLEAGADEYLTKPINPKELLLRVNTMIRLGRELNRSNEVRGEQSRALGLLLDFSYEIAAARSLEEVLERTADVAAAVMCSRRASILLPDRARRELKVVKSLGFAGDEVAKIRVPLGSPTSGLVFVSQERIVVSDEAEAADRGDDPDALLLSKTPSASIALCAPESTVGVLNVSGQPGSRCTSGFTQANLEYLDLIGNLAASAIHERLTRRDRDEARHSIVVALAKLAEHRDTDTGKHLERVTQFSCLLGRKLREGYRYRAEITDEFLDDLHHAVPLHDIGKVAVPDHILKKPGPLTADEWTVMRTHTTVGAQTIQSVLSRAAGITFLTMAEEIAIGHHESFNGEGYPNALRGDTIPLAARIVAVADAYDAMTTERVYKAALPHQKTVEIIVGSSGRQFDPDIVEALCRCESQFESLAAKLTDGTATTGDPAAADPTALTPPRADLDPRAGSDPPGAGGDTPRAGTGAAPSEPQTAACADPT